MNINKYLIISLGILIFGFSLFAFATSERDIIYPVAELGNCQNKQECKAYCSEEENIEACIAFARKHNLMSEKEVKRAETVASLPPGGGPGGCSTLEQCAAYCGTVDHIQECLVFAKQHGLMEQKELQEAEKVLKAVQEKGVKLPGGCTSKEQCEAYCHEEGHMDECIEFARQAGFMSDEEYQIAKKTGGRGPGGCKGRECEAYCEDEAHFDECIAFAKEHGLISEKEAEIAKKTGGKGPGGCHGRECKVYCENPDHFEACLEFGRQEGFLSDKEYEIAKKTGGKGPGGCRGEDECRAYCEGPSHQEECFNFAKEHGFISEEEVKRIEEFKRGEGFKGREGPPPPAQGVNVSCEVDNDCTLISKNALIPEICWKDACKGIDYSKDEFVAVNKGWSNGVLQEVFRVRREICGPAPSCPSFIVNNNFKAVCIQHMCRKVPSDYERPPFEGPAAGGGGPGARVDTNTLPPYERKIEEWSPPSHYPVSPEEVERLREQIEKGEIPVPPGTDIDSSYTPPPGFTPPPPTKSYPPQYQQYPLYPPPPSDFNQSSQPQSSLQRFGATLLNTLQFLMGR